VIAWNWLNLVVFDLANQRFPDAVKEDALNKPRGPIPAGYITPKQMRQVLLASIPVVFGINRFFFGHGKRLLSFLVLRGCTTTSKVARKIGCCVI